MDGLAGRQARPGRGVMLDGRFTLTPAGDNLDLGGAGVTILSLLGEGGGAGELVDRVAAGPVHLVARPGGRSTSATFESQPTSDRPRFRIQIEQRSAGLVDFTLKVDRATLSHDPLLCSSAQPSTTNVETGFVIDDGLHAPVTVATALAWKCVGRAARPGSELQLR